jgi:hypothetical protein
MKKIKNRLTAFLLTGMAVVCTLPACQKGFNTKSYDPSKPLPAFDGYSSSKSIASSNLVAFQAQPVHQQAQVLMQGLLVKA